jgi:putative ubiquitin-RnfH superfamily antitoxin RatB of RatAB toxin-antitoxin module
MSRCPARRTVSIVEPPISETDYVCTSSVSATCAVALDHERSCVQQRERMIEYRQELLSLNDPMTQIQNELAAIEAARERIAQMKEARKRHAEELRKQSSPLHCTS